MNVDDVLWRRHIFTLEGDIVHWLYGYFKISLVCEFIFGGIHNAGLSLIRNYKSYITVYLYANLYILDFNL